MGTGAWVSRSCVLGANSLKARMVVFELLKAATHSGTPLGLLTRGPGSRRLSSAALPGALVEGPAELGALTMLPTGRLGGAGAAGAKYCHGSGGRRW